MRIRYLAYSRDKCVQEELGNGNVEKRQPDALVLCYPTAARDDISARDIKQSDSLRLFLMEFTQRARDLAVEGNHGNIELILHDDFDIPLFLLGVPVPVS